MTDILERLANSSCNESSHELQCRCFDAAEEVSRNRAAIAELVGAASRLIEHADFRLAGCLNDQSNRADIPSNAVSSVKTRHLAALRALITKHQQPTTTKEDK